MPSRDRASYLITAEDDSKRALDSAKRGLRGLSDQADHVRRAMRTLTAGLSVGAFVAFVKSGINAAEQLSVVSKRTGIAVEDLSALKFAAEQSDTSFETLTTGLQRFELGMAKAGVSGRDTIGMLTALADRVRQTEDPAKRLQIAVAAFGRSAGPELVPFLTLGGEGINALIQKLRDMGGVITGETAAAADEFNDQLAAIRTQLSALGTELGGGFIEGFREFSGELTDPEMLASMHELGELLGTLTRAAIEFSKEIAVAAAAVAGFKIGGGLGGLFGPRGRAAGGLLGGLTGGLSAYLGLADDTEAASAGGATGSWGDSAGGATGSWGDSDAARAYIDSLGATRTRAGKTGGRAGRPERNEFAEALADLQREIAMTGELTNAEKILYETQQGRYAAFSEAQKQALIAKAGELDATLKANQAAEESARLAERNREQVEQGIEALQSETTQANVALIEDDRARAEAQLDIEAQHWRDIIALAAEGTAERQNIETAYNDWMTARRAELNAGFSTQNDELEELTREAARDMQNAMSSLFFDIFQGRIDDLGARFKAFVDQMLADWLASQIQMALFGKGFGEGGGLGGIFGSLFGSGGGGGDLTIDGILAGAGAPGGAPVFGNARGNAFESGNVIPFARGGVVDRKTVMPMAMMGEAGPEAILPLRRTADGHLGVMAGREAQRQSSGPVIHFHLPNVTNKSEFERSVGQSARNAAQLLDRAARRNG